MKPTTLPPVSGEEKLKAARRLVEAADKFDASTTTSERAVFSAALQRELNDDSMIVENRRAARQETIRECIYAVDKELENGSPEDTWNASERAADRARRGAIEAIEALFGSSPNPSTVLRDALRTMLEPYALMSLEEINGRQRERVRIARAALQSPDSGSAGEKPTREELIDELQKAAKQFHFYEEQHLAKTPPDWEKAQTNRIIAERIDGLFKPHRVGSAGEK